MHTRALCALAWLHLFASDPAEACSVCLAGDPWYSAFGASAEPVGSFSLYVEGRTFDKSSGGLPHGDEEGEEEPHGASSEDSNGDASLGASVVLWQNRDVLPSTWLEGRLWLKAPTGRDHTEVDGEPDPHLQPGTGSWDWGTGLAAGQRLSWGSLYASLYYRENSEGSFDYEYGDAFFANAAVEAPLGHALGVPEWNWLTPGFELNFRYAGYDHAEGERYEDSGGAILYATPTLRIRLPFGLGARNASLRAAVQLPFAQTWLHNTQHEGEVWSLGLLLPF